jgi:hypothetical protein
MELAIACVMKSGGDYSPDWVYKLRAGLERGGLGHLPFFCFSDRDDLNCNTVQLEVGLPGWWSKLELFRLNTYYDWLYFDLDMVVTGDLRPLEKICRDSPNAIMLRDFYRHQELASGMMFIPEAIKREVWPGFLARKEHYMKESHGDQEVIADLLPNAVSMWQDKAPGLVKSYKGDNCAERGPQGASVVMFHGQPRPNAVQHEWMQW